MEEHFKLKNFLKMRMLSISQTFNQEMDENEAEDKLLKNMYQTEEELLIHANARRPTERKFAKSNSLQTTWFESKFSQT